MKRTETRSIYVKDLQIGGQNKVVIQSMTNTKTKDIEATVAQIKALEGFGCELIRLAILDEEDAYAIKELVKESKVPLVADIHFNYKLALIAIESGIHKIRLNPGNIKNKDHIALVVKACKEKHIPIRIGINSGSLEKDILAKYGGIPCAEAMIESAWEHVNILTSLDFHEIALSFKSSDVRLTIDVYEKASKIFPYPLHLGVTEAGTLLSSSIKSSAALGILLHQGIGDTIRISISDDPVEEIKVAKQLLKAFGLYKNVADLVACPTCGRLQYDMLPIVNEIEAYLNNIQKDITVAVMGCPVNGPQEASRADLGVAGGYKEALLFKKGQFVRSIPQASIVEELKMEIEKYIIENKL
ncbi:MAG: (E)-4-hydroxy-3-methylbut-2-enyl-diphosphate synthase [Erysipelotrichaceae bacterium]|nr:MAG: (E)-4-hydroxy-3-methylbut-2-enyl-diphosphate [Erysipelotrichaceae bacterium]TXT17340.1 MAG: (E)-4-hydroxy-3-methylbut-2-enyl-diphosphate synthase [Erysipelotrichaceae bacterium]